MLINGHVLGAAMGLAGCWVVRYCTAASREESPKHLPSRMRHSQLQGSGKLSPVADAAVLAACPATHDAAPCFCPRAIVTAVLRSLTLWQGPPGTGKTRTLLALVEVCHAGSSNAISQKDLVTNCVTISVLN